MAERPILFSGRLVRAILAGRKTQTRRPVRGWAVAPPAEVGDLLYVRETWWRDEDVHGSGPTYYRADHPEDGYTVPRWRPSIHMPKCYARIWLKVTEVRCERLQSISRADAYAEGLERKPGDILEGVAASRFGDGWDAIYGKDQAKRWSANPFVWVITFERTEAPAP